jgi:hypothetical protein
MEGSSMAGGINKINPLIVKPYLHHTIFQKEFIRKTFGLEKSN